MNITDITKSEVYYIDTDDAPWYQWQTNKQGTYWLNLMGMSWEEMEPPEELVEQFNALVALLNTTQNKGNWTENAGSNPV